MKNIVTIDLDSEREQQVQISKPQDLAETLKTNKDVKDLVMIDITTIVNGLSTLIQLGDDKDYFKSSEVSKICIKHLNDIFNIENDEV